MSCTEGDSYLMPHGGGAILRSGSFSLEMGASLSSSGSSAMLDREAAKADGGLPRVVSVQRMRAIKPYQKLFRQVGWTMGWTVAGLHATGGASACHLRRMHVQMHAFGR